jgi:hypothetical protein
MWTAIMVDIMEVIQLILTTQGIMGVAMLVVLTMAALIIMWQCMTPTTTNIMEGMWLIIMVAIMEEGTMT